MSGLQLEGDEIRPQIQLSPEEIAALEAERIALREAVSGIRRSDAGRISGEGSALEETPRVINIRQKLAAQRAAAGEPVEPGWAEAPNVEHAPVVVKTITAEAEVLTRLMIAAKKAQAEATEYRQLCDTAEADAAATREALQDYLKEHGLA